MSLPTDLKMAVKCWNRSSENRSSGLQTKIGTTAYTYKKIIAHSPTFPSLHLRHRSFSNPSVALSTSQFILKPFRRFTYVIAHSPTLLSLLLRHRLFTWRAAHGFRKDIMLTTWLSVFPHLLTSVSNHFLGTWILGTVAPQINAMFLYFRRENSLSRIWTSEGYRLL